MNFIRDYNYYEDDLGRTYVIISILYTTIIMYMVMNFILSIL